MAIPPGGCHPRRPEWRSSNERGDRSLKATGRLRGGGRSPSSLEGGRQSVLGGIFHGAGGSEDRKHMSHSPNVGFRFINLYYYFFFSKKNQVASALWKRGCSKTLRKMKDFSEVGKE